MEDEYPLYPELPEAGKVEAQKLIDGFKDKLKKAADEAITEMYCDVAVFIESDSWSNYRNKMMEGFKDYGNRKIQGDYDFKEIRKKIFEEYRDEIVEDLNLDLVDEIVELKKQLESERELNRMRY